MEREIESVTVTQKTTNFGPAPQPAPQGDPDKSTVTDDQDSDDNGTDSE